MSVAKPMPLPLTASVIHAWGQTTWDQHMLIVLRELLNTEGVDINITDEQRRTPLHFAVVTNRRSVIQLLVELGCNIDVQGCSGRTPLLAAVTSDQLDCARMLIGLGADLNLTGNNGTTPLYHMCSHKKPVLEFIQLLLSKKCNVNITNLKGATPLMCACSLRNLPLVKLLLEHGANINQRDDNGMTAIEFCVGHKTRLSSLLLCLIHNGADINIIDRKGRTLLDIAIEKMVLTNIVALLLADVHRDAAIMQQENILYLCDRLPEFKAWIIEEIHTPRSLKRLSRGYIRGQLGPEGLVRASSLDLPRVLQDFLLCRDIGPKDLEPYSTAFLSLTLLVMPQ
ncbi:ankyrin repeat domain-containing protein 7-like [Mya arenaria]|uniref:ankyrin repeat domain-containing protein 7-like n=1 Tax=Mya arenaria TaxID=6604 RepID=UPI0022E0C038|nr:ankyrin repeat domain-containing protein 7-like [Mya arenaria]